MPVDEWLATKDASKYLETIGCFVSPKTLANMRANANAGKGPSFTRTRLKAIRYLKADLKFWALMNVERIE
jgi:hypothetical protein